MNNAAVIGSNKFSIKQVALQTRQVAGFVDFMASNGRYIWATNQDVLQKYCAQHDAVVAEISVPKAAGIPVCAFSAVWVASLENQSIYKIDQISNEILAIIPTGLADLTGEFSLAASHDAIWVMSAEGLLTKISPCSGRIETHIEVLDGSYNVCFGAGLIWLSNTQHASIQCIDPILNRVTHCITVDETPWFITANNQYVFSLNQKNGTVSKIDAVTCKCVQTIQLPELACGEGGDIFASNHRLWVRTTHLLLIEIDYISGKIIRQITADADTGSGAVIQCGEHLWISAHDVEKMWLIKA